MPGKRTEPMIEPARGVPVVMENSADVCLFLRNRRAMLGRSQLSVARRIGVSQGVLSKWEQYGVVGHSDRHSNATQPPGHRVFAWMKALGVSMSLTCE